MIKKFNNFIKEELDPFTYIRAADKLHPVYHKDRKEALIKKYKDELNKFPTFNGIILIDKDDEDEHYYFNNCKIYRILGHHYEAGTYEIVYYFIANCNEDDIFNEDCEEFVIRTELGSGTPYLDLYGTTSKKSFRVDDKDVLFDSRKNALKFANFALDIFNKKGVLNNSKLKTIKGNLRYYFNLNDYYISNKELLNNIKNKDEDNEIELFDEEGF